MRFRRNRLDEADERECESVLHRDGRRDVKVNKWQRALALPLHSLVIDDKICRVLTSICNNSHDVEVDGLSFLPMELAIDANFHESAIGLNRVEWVFSLVVRANPS